MAEERLLAGKYKTPDELEKGFQNLVAEISKIKSEKQAVQVKAEANERLIAELKGLYEAQQAQAIQAKQPRVVDSEGELNEAGLMALIEQQIAPVRKAIAEVPNVIHETITQVFRPVAAQNQAASDFFGRDDLEGDFSIDAMNRFLGRNPGIKETFDVLAGNPQTAGKAYEYAYTTWKATAKPSNAVSESRKRDAGTTPKAAGPPLEIPGEGQPDAKALAELAAKARRSLDPLDQVAYLKARLEGTAELEDLRDVARQRGWRE